MYRIWRVFINLHQRAEENVPHLIVPQSSPDRNGTYTTGSTVQKDTPGLADLKMPELSRAAYEFPNYIRIALLGHRFHSDHANCRSAEYLHVTIVQKISYPQHYPQESAKALDLQIL